MKRKEKSDIAGILSRFEKIYRNRPSVPVMYREIQMMKFKIKPLHGDISKLNIQNSKFIETLWSLGRMDEIFQSEYKHIHIKNREVAYRLFADLYQEFQEKLNKIELKEMGTGSEAPHFEVEIYKDSDKKTN